VNEQPTHLDLFSGIGGFAIAAQRTGFQTVAFCEIDGYCQALLRERFGAVMADAGCDRRRRGGGPDSTRTEASFRSPRLYGDIRTLDATRYRGCSLLTGGFPCQPFSVAGKREGAADDRFLWPEMLRVIDEARPTWVLGENVAGIVQMELDRVLSDLESLGYACWPLVIPACAVDAKHRRDRVWIVANTRSGGRGQGSTGWRGTVESRAHNEPCESRQDTELVANGSKQGLQRGEVSGSVGSIGTERTEQPQRCGELSEWCSWLPEPNVGRVANGVSKRMDRLKGLGNAIVPQVAYEILKGIRSLL
jgi:DNA (cytosine-5)-methyltransferase 1